MTSPYWDAQARLFVATYQRVHGRLVLAAFIAGSERAFVRDYQREHGLLPDGAAGPKTFVHLQNMCWPVTSVNGRNPIVTRGTAPGHNAADIAFWAVDGDPKTRLRYLKEYGREYAFPEEAIIVAMADGIVVKANRISTGYWCWVGHLDGTQTGYFHGSELLVAKGDLVKRAQPIMEEGHDPRYGPNLIHLHGERRVDGIRQSMEPLLETAAYVCR